MFHYAQLDGDSIVKAVSRLAREEHRLDFIVIPDYDESLLGKKYENGQFIDPPEPEPPEPLEGE